MNNISLTYHPLTFFKNHNLTPRQQQTDVLEEIFKNWGSYSYFACSLPVGVGKTYIATGIADALKKAYIITSTLQLQNQYETSWDEIVNLKGRSNYTCNVNPNFTVDAAPCAANKDLYADCMQHKTCSYYNQKNLAIQSRAMITNPVYMLYSTHCGFAKDEESPWVKRDVLIIDEAHNLENHLVSFAESTIDPIKYHEDFGCDTDKFQFTGDQVADYMMINDILSILLDKAQELAEKLEKEFPVAKFTGVDPRVWARGFSEKAAEKVRKMNVKMNAVDKAIQPLKIFFSTHSTPEELSRRWLMTKIDGQNVVKLSPIYGDFLFKEYFGTLADKFIFLSATLGTKQAFSKELGLVESELLYVETDSPFPPEKSPVIVMPSIKLSKDHYENNAKKAGGLIDEILKLHPNQRGIIHCVTYDLQKHIFNGVTPANRKRLLCRDMDTLSGKIEIKGYPKKYKNEELLKLHETSKQTNTILLSPSMMEGVDLHDDLSEFQVIIKLPWANLGDARIRLKSQLDPNWYANKMWLSILQASGRSTRHEEDSSTTYLLDENAKYFYDQWKHNLPSWFKKRLIF
jgi:ATP-dependent DNA helicase DinG